MLSCVKGCGQGFGAKWDNATPGTAGGALPDCWWERGRQSYHKSQGTALWQRCPDRNCGLSKMPCSQPLDTQQEGRLRNKHLDHIFFCHVSHWLIITESEVNVGCLLNKSARITSISVQVTHVYLNLCST